MKVIQVENISKLYRLGQVGTGSIFHDVNRWWHTVRGKDDPYMRVGELNDRTQKGKSDYVWALKDINFEVEQGEVLGIIGRNGAGKSTLLKILSRTTAPTTGSIKVKGRIASLLEVGTGFHPELSGRDNIFMNGTILGMTRSEIKSQFEEIVEFAGVERYLDTPVKRYSSGMYVRLAFAVAAHLESEILIVDEVLAVGDMEFQKKCLGKMKDVSEKQGRTVLFVSHNMESILNLSTRLIYLNQGSFKYYSTPSLGLDDYHTLGYNLENGNGVSNEINIYGENDYIEISNLSIVDESETRKFLFINPDFIKVIVECKIKKEDPLLVLGGALYNLTGANLIWSIHLAQPKPINLSKGHRKIELIIPTGNLNSGKYQFDIIAGIHNKEWVYRPRYNSPTINFSIHNQKIDTSIWGNTKPGVLSVEIEYRRLV